VVQGSELWTAGWIFGEHNWQHAGLYSRSDEYGSKYIIHALGGGVTVQETPSYFLFKISNK